MKKKTPKKEMTLEHLSTKIDDLSVTVDTLVSAVARGFVDVSKQFKAMDRRFDILEDNLTSRLNGADRRTDDLILSKINPIDIRLSRVEKKVGVK